MTRLKRHDEIVERIRDAIVKPRYNHAATYEIASAALDALLTAVVELGVGRESTGEYTEAGWVATDFEPESDEFETPFPALIIQREDKP